MRAVLAPLEHSHIAAIKATGEIAARDSAVHWCSIFASRTLRRGWCWAFCFIAILAASLRVTRLWCRVDLPAGRAAGRGLALVRCWGCTRTPTSCDNCNRCLLHCQGGDDPIGGVPWRKSECLMCMNCVGSCPHDSLQFRFFRKEKEVASPDLGRRRTLTGLAAGAALVPLMRANTGLGKSRNERLLRPPGSLDETDFLSPLHPLRRVHEGLPQQRAASHARSRPAWKGLWTPTLVPRIGYCEPSCVLCSEVCPTGAIWQITPKEKGWVVGVGQHRASRSAWALHSTIAAAACPGPWPPIALSARSGARFRPRRFMCKRRR